MYSFVLCLFSEPIRCELKGREEVMATTARQQIRPMAQL